MKVVNLNIGYSSKKGSKSIAKSAMFSLEPSELIGVIGINGSGKSTLLKTLSGLQQPLDGDVRLDEGSLFMLTPKALAKKISLVLTGQHFSKNLTVRELVALGRQPYTNWIGKLSNADKKTITQAEQLAGITGLLQKSCGEISDGQLQKVLIARALAQNTPYIILDEPTTHLDLHHKSYVLQLLKTLTETTQKTILFATHEVNMALDICDKLIVIKNSRIYMDSPSALIASNILDDLFPNDSIMFDATRKQFTMITK